MVYNIVMKKVNVFEIKAKLSEYLDRAASGERILICRHNKPVAELRAIEEARLEPRPIGPLPGRPTFEVPPSFFQPMSGDELDLWEGADGAHLTEHGLGRGASRVAESKAEYRVTPRRRSRKRQS